MNDRNTPMEDGDEAMTTETRESRVDVGPRCWRCDRKLGERLTRPWEVRCTRCKVTNTRGTGGGEEEGATA